MAAATAYRRIDHDEKDPEAIKTEDESGTEDNAPFIPAAVVAGVPLPALSPSMVTIFIIFSWYCSNIGVLLLNKYLLSNYGFRYPIFLTLCHMCSCCVYSYISIERFEVVPMQFLSSTRQFFKIVGLSSIFCLSVVLGNMSLKYIPVSFNQAIGATTPAFTALFVFLITFKTETLPTYLTLIPVVLGIVIASNSEPSFHLFGFAMCVASTAGRALKSVVQGILLTNENEKLHSMNLLLYMSPIAVALLLPASLLMEGNIFAVVVAKSKEDPFMLVMLFANATLAYLTNLTNFLVTKHTSALTLQVLGNAKGAVAAVVSILIFKNPVKVMGIVGFGITIGGVVLYGEAKKRTKH